MTYANTDIKQLYRIIQGREVPAVGFGTYELDNKSCVEAVETALETGYRHIDTARMYGNEREVGAAIRTSGIPREEIFLTSKVWYDELEPANVELAVNTSLELMDTSYLDLALIHWPNPNIRLEDTLEKLMELHEQGLLRHIGVSNFPTAWMKRALKCAPVFCNQVEYHPMLDQSAVHALCQEEDILLTAYSPLGQGAAMGNPTLEKIAGKHGKNTAQVAIRWLIEQENVAAIPRSGNPDHIRGNFDVFDFSLDEDDRSAIAALPKDRRQIDPEMAPEWDS